MERARRGHRYVTAVQHGGRKICPRSRQTAVDRGNQQAEHAPVARVGALVGGRKARWPRHRVACGGPGGSPHVTVRCVRGSASSADGPGNMEFQPVVAVRPPVWACLCALTVLRASARVTHPSERPPLALRQPKETLRRAISSGQVLRDTRHQHRPSGRRVPGRSLKTE